MSSASCLRCLAHCPTRLCCSLQLLSAVAVRLRRAKPRIFGTVCCGGPSREPCVPCCLTAIFTTRGVSRRVRSTKWTSSRHWVYRKVTPNPAHNSPFPPALRLGVLQPAGKKTVSCDDFHRDPSTTHIPPPPPPSLPARKRGNSPHTPAANTPSVTYPPFVRMSGTLAKSA
jgi:hypothetical protein